MDYPATSPALAAALRPGHVLRISDIDGLALDDLVDSVATDLPVFLDYRGPADRTARDVVTEVLDALESIVLALFPTWLPGHHAGELLDADEAEDAARRLCRDAAFTSSAVVHFARVAAGAPSAGSSPGNEARAAALTFLLRRSYHRDTVVLAVRASPDLPVRAQQAAAAACRWIADHGRLAVWLTSDALLAVPWVPGFRIGVGSTDRSDLPTPDSAADESVDRATGPPLLTVSRPAGSPAPHSAAEQALERALTHQHWARDRQWNRSPRDLDPLSPAVVVDLLWTRAKVVVEVDGADHRGPVKYARDRRRDNMLQRAGYLVLRYTNEQVLDDAALVVAELAAVLAERTRPTGARAAPTSTSSPTGDGRGAPRSSTPGHPRGRTRSCEPCTPSSTGSDATSTPKTCGCTRCSAAPDSPRRNRTSLPETPPRSTPPRSTLRLRRPHPTPTPARRSRRPITPGFRRPAVSSS